MRFSRPWPWPGDILFPSGNLRDFPTGSGSEAYGGWVWYVLRDVEGWLFNDRSCSFPLAILYPEPQFRQFGNLMGNFIEFYDQTRQPDPGSTPIPQKPPSTGAQSSGLTRMHPPQKVPSREGHGLSARPCSGNPRPKKGGKKGALFRPSSVLGRQTGTPAPPPHEDRHTHLSLRKWLRDSLPQRDRVGRHGQRIRAYMYACVSINTRLRYRRTYLGVSAVRCARMCNYAPEIRLPLKNRFFITGVAYYAVRVYTRIRSIGACTRI
jgi:hypothetical protein